MVDFHLSYKHYNFRRLVYYYFLNNGFILKLINFATNIVW